MKPSAPTHNPFISHRWETEVEHRIWIPPEALKVASTKACLISGLRGTGKTALLNCLDPLAVSRDRVRFLNPQDRPINCIGVYVNILAEFMEFLPLRVPNAWQTPIEETPGQAWLHAHWFRTYLIFTCLSRTLEVIDECQRAGVLTYTAEEESDYVERFLRLWDRHFAQPPRERPIRSLLDCASILAKVCMATRINSVRLYPDRVSTLLEQLEPIGFYRDFCRCLTESGLLTVGERHCHVKISLDDVHRFDRNEQALLNGIIEVNAAPVTWNLSYVTGGYDPTLSPDPNAPLTRHDAEHVDLDYVNNPKGFRRLCQKLYDMRVGNDPARARDSGDTGYAKVLSNPNVSVLFHHLVRDTTSRSFQKRINDHLDYVGQAIEAKLDGDGPRQGMRRIDPRKYLYQTYVFVTLFGTNKGEFERFLHARSGVAVDNYFRQKNVAALVCAANELGAQTPYAGKNVLISLSDGCLRDFLRILAVLYDSVAGDTYDTTRGVTGFFLPGDQRQIPLESQSRGFVEASRSYLEQAENATDRVGRVLAGMIGAIAEFTRLLQSKDRVRALALPERGLIRLNFAEATLLGDPTDRIALLRDALATGQNTGTIRILEGVFRSRGGVLETDEVKFRLHRLVAPYHNYSSRGPYRTVYVPLTHFLEFAEGRPVNPRDWAERVLKTAQDENEAEEPDTSQQDLF